MYRGGSDMGDSNHLRVLLQTAQDNLTGSRASMLPPPRPPSEKWMSLDRGVFPCPGESLRSIVARTCAANHLPHSWGLLGELGLPHRNRVRVSEEPLIDPAELAFAILLPEQAVTDRRYNDVGGKRNFFGLMVQPEEIESRVRRFSPAFHRAPRAGNRHRTHQAMWELASIPFCLESWDMLQDTCYCEMQGIPQRWILTRTDVDECDRCGDPLKELQSVPVPDHMRPALSVLSAIAHPVPAARAEHAHLLPEALRTTDRGFLFKMVLDLAHAISPDAIEYGISEPDKRLHGLHLACKALMTWPKSLASTRLSPQTPKTTREKLRKEWFELSVKHEPPAISIDIIDNGSTTSAAKFGKRRKRLIGHRPATELAKLSYGVLEDAWNEGLLTQHLRPHGAREVMAFDPDELIEFAAKWTCRIKPESLSHEFGISKFGVEQLAALGIMKADGLALPGTGPFFSPHSRTDFLSSLWERRRPAFPDSISLYQVIAGIGGRPKPWGHIFELLLAESIPFHFTPDTTSADGLMPLPRKIHIPNTAASAICGLRFDRDGSYDVQFSDDLVQTDVFEWLNGTESLKAAISHLKPSGTIPLRFRFSDVAALSQTVATTREVAYYTKADQNDLYRDLERAGIPQPFANVWCRRTLQSKGYLPA